LARDPPRALFGPQRVLKSTPFDQCAFVADELMTELIPNSRNPYGCCVIQLVMERCSPKQLQSIIDSMRPETTRLAQCPYARSLHRPDWPEGLQLVRPRSCGWLALPYVGLRSGPVFGFSH
jgi:hypothetical protein